MVRLFQILIIVFSIQINFSQEEKLELSTSVDSTSIKVGQQFNYIIKVADFYYHDTAKIMVSRIKNKVSIN